MFKVVTEQRKTRLWTPRNVALSAGAHLLVLAAFAATAQGTGPTESVAWTDLPPVPPARTPPPPPPVPVAVHTPPPARTGRTVELPAPDRVPVSLPPIDSSATPLTPDQTSGIGPTGQVPGPPNNAPPTPDPVEGPLPNFPEAYTPENVDVLPQVANTREAQRLLERQYPPVLRDAGVAGRTVVTLVIDRNGNVEPGSVSVTESSHDAFRDAAVRAVEHFRFRPARLNGQPVSVIISIPIEWQIAH
jgi:protein TonB